MSFCVIAVARLRGVKAEWTEPSTSGQKATMKKIDKSGTTATSMKMRSALLEMVSQRAMQMDDF
jgi:hypothetical protein